ncbi:MAG: nitroreductase family protein [Bacteroides sp.]|jgi:nitroreductase|nr:nitroreductase family protein [Bacteroides sp.]
MEKPAITDKNLHPLLKSRWSPRSFDSRPVEADKLQRIFEAARWAPSSFNEQPWRFMLGIKGDETWDKIFDSLLEWNQQWAVTAPVLVMAIGSKHYEMTGKESDIYKYDVGQAIGHMTFQVMEEGLMMHQMGGFSKKKAIENFDIPEEFQPLTVSAIGYQAAPEQLPEEFAKMEYNERRRRTPEEQVFAGRFGQPSPLAK